MITLPSQVVNNTNWLLMEETKVTNIQDSKDIINMIKEHFLLTEDDRRRLSDGVTMERPLERSGLKERPRTGYYQITARGLEFLNRTSGAGGRNLEEYIEENYQKIRDLTRD